jgi:hypothetical protein
MTIKVVSHEARWCDAVEAFNGRMHAKGSPWGFYVDPVPTWIPEEHGASAWREYYLVVENDEHVRGGYALRPQQWLINGETRLVTDWQGPFTEGAVDPRYASLGLRLIRDMLKKYPLLFSLGHGGTDEPMVQLLRSLKWTLHEVPFCFKVLKPYRFLRMNRYLRQSGRQRSLLDLLAWTGAGSLGIRVLQWLHRWRAPASARASGGATSSVVDSFGDWADALWAKCQDDYRCLAVRDSKMMNRLLPATGWPGGTRLRVDRDGVTVGWAVVHCKQLQDDPRFGNLYVAMITDCFGATSDAPDVMAAVDQYVSGQGVDMVFANLAHRDWVSALQALGHTVLEGRRLFAISPQLRDAMAPFDETIAGLHLTNMDGHGPHGFTDDD